jgi:HEAT repeat protein
MNILLVLSFSLSVTLVPQAALADRASGSDFNNYYQNALVARGVENSTSGFMRALGNRDPTLRLYAAQALAERGDRVAVPALAKALDDSDATVAYQAARALAILGSPAGSAALRRAADGPDPIRASEAAGLLADLGDPSAYPAVLRALHADQPGTSLSAVSTLLKFYRYEHQAAGGVRVNVVEQAGQMVELGSSTAVRLNAIAVLSKLGDRRAIPVLRRSAGAADPAVASAAGSALALLPAQ